MVSRVKARVVIKILTANGWVEQRCSGSHHIFHNPETGSKQLNVDFHDSGDSVAAATVNRIVKTLGAENVPEEWLPGGRYKPAAHQPPEVSEAKPPCVVEEAKAKKASKSKEAEKEPTPPSKKGKRKVAATMASTSKEAEKEHTPSKKGKEKPCSWKGKGKKQRK
jgi:predicted RNA binding protein YcfA (HicA-like mRNA interferase family)